MSLLNPDQRTQRIMERIGQLSRISEDPHCLTRTYGSESFRKAQDVILSWMSEAGLETRIDHIGNVRGQTLSHDFPRKKLIIGSHIDTVKNAGKFDGQLGLLIALDLAEQLQLSHENLPFDIEVVGFCDEEGVRFTTTYLGSSALSNTFQDEWLDRKDDQGISLSSVIEQNDGDPDAIPDDSLHPDECLGYYEVHIEQGPVLENKNIPVGIVTSIAGQTRVEIRFKGRSGHAGTTPLNLRQDALCAAACFVSEVEAYARQSQGEVIATVGKLTTLPNVSNVIPSEVVCSLDLRSPYNEVMEQALDILKTRAKAMGMERNVTVDWNILQENKGVHCDPLFCELLEKAIDLSEVNEVVKLCSGAGHDAVALSRIMPVNMLFVRCKEGISHHPDEFVASDDVHATLQVSDLFIEQLINFHRDEVYEQQASESYT